MAATLSKGEKLATALEALDFAEGKILRALKAAKRKREQRAMIAALAYTRGAQTEIEAIKQGASHHE